MTVSKHPAPPPPPHPTPPPRNTQTSAFQSAISRILQWKSRHENIHLKLFGLGVKWLYLTLVIMMMSCVNTDRQALNFCDAKWQQCIQPVFCSSLRARESRSSCTVFSNIRGSQRTDRRVLHFMVVLLERKRYCMAMCKTFGVPLIPC